MRWVIAKILGWQVVWLIDHDNEAVHRLARPTPHGLLAWRMSRVFRISPVLCLEGGRIKAMPGNSYIKRWQIERPQPFSIVRRIETKGSINT